MTVKALAKDPFNLIITGVGGQGNVSMSVFVGDALVRQGYFVTVGETYGASQRGGPVMSHIRVSQETHLSPFISDGRADVVLGMEPAETLRILGQYGNPDVVTIVNPRPVHSIDVTGGDVEYPDLDSLLGTIGELSARMWVVRATEEAQRLGSPLYANTILIGALVGAAVLPLDRDEMGLLLRKGLTAEVETNLAAFARGIELVTRQT